MQRYSMQKEEAKDELERRPRKKQPLLVLGIVLFVGSGIFLSLALVFAPQTLLAPCGIIIFVANALFAHFLNGESFVWKEDGLCNAFVMVGVLMCVFAAPKQEKDQGDDAIKTYTDVELIALYKEPTFIIFVAWVLVVGCTFWGVKSKFLRDMDHDWVRLSLDVPKMTMINLSFGIIAGTLGGFNITLTKSMFQVMGGEFKEDGLLGLVTSPLCWVLGLSLLATFIFQMRCVTDGLEKCTAMVVVPAQSVTEEATATLGGLLYFQDYTQFELWNATVFFIGDLIAIGAVVAMVTLRVRRHEEGAPDADAIYQDVAMDSPSARPVEEGNPVAYLYMDKEEGNDQNVDGNFRL